MCYCTHLHTKGHVKLSLSKMGSQSGKLRSPGLDRQHKEMTHRVVKGFVRLPYTVGGWGSSIMAVLHTGQRAQRYSIQEVRSLRVCKDN